MQLSQSPTFWTSASNFDAGGDVVGTPRQQTTQSTTTINITLTGLDPIQRQDIFPVQSNTRGFELWFLGRGSPGATTVNVGEGVNSNIDFSSINTIFFGQLEPLHSGGLSGLVLGPALTQSPVTITSGTTNNLSGALTPSPQASIPLHIKGSAWATNYQNSAPAMLIPLLTDYSVSAQPFATDRVANGLPNFIGANLTMLVPRGPSTGGFSLTAYFCGESSGPKPVGLGNLTLPPILTDQDFGTISYGDPFPTSWPRMFQICQQAAVQIPRPNSTLTDSYRLTFGETTAIPSAPIIPLLEPVQNPMINGSSIFQAAALGSPGVNLSWSAPAGLQPSGYYVTVYQLATLSTGATQYVTVGRFGTSKTSMAVPSLTAGNTYIFQIVAWVDGIANMETSPFRSKLPNDHSTVISTPVNIN